MKITKRMQAQAALDAYLLICENPTNIGGILNAVDHLVSVITGFKTGYRTREDNRQAERYIKRYLTVNK